MKRTRTVKERYSVARFLAAAMLSLIAVAALDAFFVQVPPDPVFNRVPIYCIAAIAGFVAGWHDLGRHLGAGNKHAIAMSMGAVFAGLVYFALACGFGAMVKVFYYTSFSTVMALFDYWLTHSIEFFLSAGTFQSAFILVLGGIITGAASERLHRSVMSA